MPSSAQFFASDTCAPSLARTDLCVLWRERMSVQAMCFNCVFRRVGVSAQYVSAVINDFQMGGIAAGSVAAKVVKVKTARHVSNKELVDSAVDQNGSRASASVTAVSLGVFEVRPRPAVKRGQPRNGVHERAEFIAVYPWHFATVASETLSV